MLALAVAGAACSSSGYHYVKNSDDRTYFKVPDGWKLYDEDELTARGSRLVNVTPSARRAGRWRSTPARGRR